MDWWTLFDVPEAPPVLWPFQERAVAELRELIRRLPPGKRRVVLQSSTGSGKTVMAAHIIERAVENGKRVLFLAHTRELIRQASRKLASYGVRHGIIMAGVPYEPWHPVQVASKATLISRAFRRGTVKLPPADLVIPDECHRSMSQWWQNLLEYYPRAVVLGLTATPCRSDGRGLGDYYCGMVQAARTSELIADGFLVPTDVYAPYRPNLNGVPVRAGEYDMEKAAAKMDRPKLVGDVVSHWLRIARGQKTILFATNVRHSIHLRDQFVKAGVAAAHVDGETDSYDRDKLFDDFASGKVTVLCNCAVATEGVDIPDATCGILARPVRSFGTFLQMVGRIQRRAEGKTRSVLLDHGGACYEHQHLPNEDVAWELEPTEVAFEKQPPPPPGDDDEPPALIVCPKCGYQFRPAKKCPACGAAIEKKAIPVQTEMGQLVKVEESEVIRREATEVDRQRFWDSCLAQMAHKGRDARGAAQMYRARFGSWPNGLRNVPQGEANWRKPVGELYPGYLARSKAKEEAAATRGLFD